MCCTAVLISCWSWELLPPGGVKKRGATEAEKALPAIADEEQLTRIATLPCEQRSYMQAYDSLQYVKTKGGNSDFSWDSSVTRLTEQQIGLDMSFGNDGTGCEWSCRLGVSPSIHYNDSMFHLDNVNVSWVFPLGLLGHGLVDLGFGNINPRVPFIY